ncbi:MAG: TIR domain-containing protein [Pseudomonadota bacterium]
MADIYIAHAPADLAKVRRLVEEFDQRGYDVWTDALLGEDCSDEISRAQLDFATIAIVVWSDASWRSRTVRARARQAAKSPLGDGGLPGLQLPEGSPEASKFFSIWLNPRRQLPAELRRSEAPSVRDFGPQSKELNDVVKAVIDLIGPPQSREARATSDGVPATLELAAARWAQIAESQKPRDFGRYLADFGEHQPVFSALASARRRSLRRAGRFFYALRGILGWLAPTTLIVGATAATLIFFAPQLRDSGCSAIQARFERPPELGPGSTKALGALENALGCAGALQASAVTEISEQLRVAEEEIVSARAQAQDAEEAEANARREAAAQMATMSAERDEAIAEATSLRTELARTATETAEQAQQIAALEQDLRSLPADEVGVNAESAVAEELRAELRTARETLEGSRQRALTALQRLHGFYDPKISGLLDRGYVLDAANPEPLQKCLIAAGAELPDHGVDGKLGPETHAAFAVAIEQAEDPARLAALLECLAS